MAVGGVDTYYDYKARRWMHRKLGGGPVRPPEPAPAPKPTDAEERTLDTPPDDEPRQSP